MSENPDQINSTKKALNFLNHFRIKGTHNLVAIDVSTGTVIGITRPNGHADLSTFIAKHNGKRNLYFSVNEPHANAPDGKLSKKDIAKINAVWLDADPRKDMPFEREKERLSRFATDLKIGPNPPTYIVDSGGGIQAFWLLDKPLEATAETIIKTESLNRGLAKQYGTDHVHNIDRIMRIPFTVNIPDEKKKQSGRKRVLSRIIHASSPTGTRYAELGFIIPDAKAEQADAFDHTEVDMDAIKNPLSEELLNRMKITFNHDQKAHDLYYGLVNKPSRSEYDFTLTQQLVWDGYSIQDIAHILWHFPHGKGKDLTKREIIRIYNRVDRPFEGLDPGVVAMIEAQVNPILAARAAGKPLPEDLKKTDWRVVRLHEMDWKYAGAPIYRNVLYENAITVIYGQSNVGKSFVASDIAGHVSLARDWGALKFKAKKPIGVFYICAEAGKSFGKRGKALLQRLGTETLPFFVLDAVPNFAKSKEDAKRLVKCILETEQSSKVKIGLVVVDTLATTFEGGNENSSEDMGLYISNMKYVQRYADTGVMIVHHSGKDQAAGARGHSSLRAATDTEIEVTAEKKGERYHRMIRVKKQREGESDLSIEFGLVVTELGTDEDGDIIDTCHLVLETDSEFESTVPSPLEDLDAGEMAVLKANAIVSKIENIHGLRTSFKPTERALKALVHRDIIDKIGMLVKSDGTLNVHALSAMAVPSAKVLRCYDRHKQSLADKGLSGFELEDIDL